MSVYLVGLVDDSGEFLQEIIQKFLFMRCQVFIFEAKIQRILKFGEFVPYSQHFLLIGSAYGSNQVLKCLHIVVPF